ncbi:extracellular solute-binding protein [Spirilliplanes yamanashiensis]|uniref:Solute-binding protein n=1 Tax=Spirilliplanes yamanashiensis TaxID=42233 RepID=A0A8J3YAH6_9ACTN|nr:extracellular solute-binding protein [Spirilliplanes yamanashiensis]MDP9815937.1 raffinose/stachyose/melibiose transport system substrate-binding protein [Spirilliplanes yamanashiensis]GIJ04193.1 solute-binding protein [Spirilliplanes yamanashiensis]
MPISRRNFLNLAIGAGAAAGLAACGSSGPGSGSGGSGSGNAAGAATYWSLSGPPGEPIRKAAIDRFNAANPDSKITPTFFQNDAYKQKIKTSIGAGEGPTMIWGWGGGGLKTYVEANQVEDLTGWLNENAALKDKIFPSSFGAATVNDKIYAMPIETVQPIVLFYNKQVFEKAGLQPPQSWGDIVDNLVPKFNAAGIAPFSLGGQSRWTNMMWLEFLLDRTAGSEVFDKVFAGEANAWSDPAVLDMLTKVQNLVKANGFIKGFSSITADSNADQALLYTGRAAMMLHGSWSYGIQQSEGGDFVKSGGLGWMNFPPVEGGKGDPSNTVGNPGQYLSISSKATPEAKEVAKKFFSTTLVDDAEIDGWIKSGGVPIIKGSDAKLGASPDAEFLKFVYDTSANAKVFAQSWDQALSPTAAETLLDNIAKLFQLQITPQQWVDSMNGVIGK